MRLKNPVNEKPISFIKNAIFLFLFSFCVMPIMAQTYAETVKPVNKEADSKKSDKKVVNNLNLPDANYGLDQISVKPDVITGDVNVSLMKYQKKARLLVFNLDGKKLISQPIKSGGENHFANILTTKGIYMIEIIDDKSVLHIQKVVVK